MNAHALMSSRLSTTGGRMAILKLASSKRGMQKNKASLDEQSPRKKSDPATQAEVPGCWRAIRANAQMAIRQ